VQKVGAAFSFLEHEDERTSMKLARRERKDTGQLSPVSRGWSPFWNLDRLHEEIDRLFDRPFGRSGGMTRFEGWMPSVDVCEDKDNVIVKAELPGAKKDEIQVSVTDGTLHLSGERKHESDYDGKDSYQSERYFGRFERDIALPTEVAAEKIQANYKDGVLTVTCPKTEESRKKQIEVKVD